MNPPSEAVLVPPRPNLGPEPPPGDPTTAAVVLAILLFSALTMTTAGLRLLRARRRRRAARPDSPGPPTGPFATRREQMAAWSAAVRDALAVRQGPQWRARTTEEIAADATLAATLGPALAARLVELLTLADRAKFDDVDGLQPPWPDLATGWLVDFVAGSSTVPAAGARSRIKGK